MNEEKKDVVENGNTIENQGQYHVNTVANRDRQIAQFAHHCMQIAQ